MDRRTEGIEVGEKNCKTQMSATLGGGAPPAEDAGTNAPGVLLRQVQQPALESNHLGLGKEWTGPH